MTTDFNYSLPSANALLRSTKADEFWLDINAGTNIAKLKDRLFVGAGADSSGNKIAGASDTGWLYTQIEAYWLERGAQVLVENTQGLIGGTFASRASDQANHSQYANSAIGVAGVAINDYAGAVAWGGYFEAVRDSGFGTTYGTETAVKNKGTDITNTPYSIAPAGATIGHWLAGGGDATYYGAPANPSTAALVIGKNATTWNKGIVFDAAGLTGADGTTGYGRALAMAKGHCFDWFASGSTTNEVCRIVSDITSVTNRVTQYFNNTNTRWNNTNGKSLFAITTVTAATCNGVTLTPSDTGAPIFAATGDSTDIDLRLAGKGAGLIRYGVAEAIGGKVANEVFPMKMADGTTKYVVLAA